MSDQTAKRTKFFRVALEGATATDGRTITREHLTDIVATFNRDTYGVRINMEHLRGFSPEPPFNAYGDVTAVRVQEDDVQIAGKTEKRLGLYAQLDPTDQLVEINRQRQKIYTSIEIQPNFGGTGKFGLVGLAVTDSPASLGTEILAFSTTAGNAAAEQIKADLDRRKQNPANLFSAACETGFELDAATGGGKGDGAASALDKIASAFAALVGGKSETPPAAATGKGDGAASTQAGDFAAMAATMQAFTAALAADRKADADQRRADRDADQARFSRLESQLGQLTGVLEKTPAGDHSARPLSTGAGGRELTDC